MATAAEAAVATAPAITDAELKDNPLLSVSWGEEVARKRGFVAQEHAPAAAVNEEARDARGSSSGAIGSWIRCWR